MIHFIKLKSEKIIKVKKIKEEIKEEEEEMSKEEIKEEISKEEECIKVSNNIKNKLKKTQDRINLSLDNSLIIDNIEKRLILLNKLDQSLTNPKDRTNIKIDDITKVKLENIQKQINLYKKDSKLELNLNQQILILDIDIPEKIRLLNKYEYLQGSSGPEKLKGEAWIKSVLSIPFGKIKEIKINSLSNTIDINNYLKYVRKYLDDKIYKMDYVKDEIIQFLAKKITNPDSKGHVLALHGSAGTGKSKLLKTLGEILELPFHQINFGGLNDVSMLTGHSETYLGSKPGKFVEILSKSKCMNPIIFMDEIDKIGSHKKQEINGILTHILDIENTEFQDNYLSDISIDLSKVFFVVAFNDINKIDSVILNRMTIIQINDFTLNDKVTIAIEKIIPNIMINLLDWYEIKNIVTNLNTNTIDINLDQELICYIINYKLPEENGVRQLKKYLEKLFNKINYLILIGEYMNDLIVENNIISIKQEFIDNCFE